MKIVQSSFFRSLCSVAAGVLLLKFPDKTLTGIIIAVGILFLLSGAISCVAYYVAKSQAEKAAYSAGDETIEKTEKPFFPIVGLGSIILGFILALMPKTFVESIMYVLGALVILGAISQFASLIRIRKLFFMPGIYWILPSLLLLTGLFVVIYPIETASMPFIIIGIALIVYGISESINSFAIYRKRKVWDRSQASAEVEDAEIVAELPESIGTAAEE